MLVYTRTTDPRLGALPPPVRRVVLDQLRTLRTTAGRDPVAEEDGFVGVLQAHDTQESITTATGRDLGSVLEGSFRDGDCLVGIVLLGNSGGAIALVSDDDRSPPELLALFRQHRTDREEKARGHQQAAG